MFRSRPSRAVGERAPVEREPHVRAAVVDRVHLVAVGEQHERVSAGVDDLPTDLPQVREFGDADEPLGGDYAGHRFTPPRASVRRVAS